MGEGQPEMVDLDYECCIGCGACADLCPDVFEMDDRTDKAHIIVFEVADRADVEEAIAICPVQCITWGD